MTTTIAAKPGTTCKHVTEMNEYGLPMATCGANAVEHRPDRMFVRNVCADHGGTVTKQTYQAAPWTGTSTIDFDTRLELAAIALDVTIAAPDETKDAVAQAIKEADELLAEPVAPKPGNAVLAYARQVIQVRGWTKGGMTAEDGSVCALQAIAIAAAGSRSELNDAVSVLLGRIKDDLGNGAMGIPSWNDSRASVDEVTRLLY